MFEGETKKLFYCKIVGNFSLKFCSLTCRNELKSIVMKKKSSLLFSSILSWSFARSIGRNHYHCLNLFQLWRCFFSWRRMMMMLNWIGQQRERAELAHGQRKNKPQQKHEHNRTILFHMKRKMIIIIIIIRKMEKRERTVFCATEEGSYLIQKRKKYNYANTFAQLSFIKIHIFLLCIIKEIKQVQQT